jgi:hypothetical protein
MLSAQSFVRRENRRRAASVREQLSNPAASVGMHEQLSNPAASVGMHEQLSSECFVDPSRHVSCSLLILRHRDEGLGDRVLPGTTSRPLVSHDYAGHKQLAAPDSPWLSPLQRTR